ncbi:variable large family protein, partial [Borreliella bissettiae]|uniref:variable large family protein n=1 Tax=Borrelia bissettiae TaxID=64897 RepID=UPI001E46ACFB
AAAAFGEDEMKKRNDKIAAAIVLRGLAKDGKFAADDGNANKATIESAVESAVGKVSGWLDEMIKAASEAATKGGTGGSEKIGESGANGGKADAGSVKEIAKGIKGIVDAAGKADGGTGGALKDVTAAAGEANVNAGKLFAVGNGGGVAAADADIKKAAAAVSAVSGEQILKAIVDAAEKKEQEGKKAGAATNPIAAAIGADGAGDAAEFGNNEMKKDDKIAAAIVLRGLAKDGKFAADAAGNETIKSAVESAVESAVGKVSGWLEEMIKAASEAATKGGTGGSEKIGDSGAAGVGKEADKGSVNGIAKGIKGIVEAAGKADGEKGDALKGVTEAGGGGNADAGKLFAVGNADAAADKKAAAAVSAVSGEQILKAIVDAAGEKDQAGAKAGDAKNPIEAAIGTAAAGAAFGDMKKDDKIAAAIVLRGLAKDGKFADAAGDDNKEAIESAVGKVSEWLD